MKVELQRLSRRDWFLGRRGQLVMQTHGHTAQIEQHLSIGIGPLRAVVVVPGPVIRIGETAAVIESGSSTSAATNRPRRLVSRPSVR